MLRPITNWSDLRHALRALGMEIYYCYECHHVWMAKAPESPVRCPQRDCRAWANSPKRDRVGRPPQTPQCEKKAMIETPLTEAIANHLFANCDDKLANAEQKRLTEAKADTHQKPHGLEHKIQQR